MGEVLEFDDILEPLLHSLLVFPALYGFLDDLDHCLDPVILLEIL